MQCKTSTWIRRSLSPKLRRLVNYKRLIRWSVSGLAWLAWLIVAFFLMVNLHEIGHTLTAWVSGDHSAYYRLYQAYPHGYCIGCNFYDAHRLSFAGSLVVSLGGLIATQIVGLAILLLRPACKLGFMTYGANILILVMLLGDGAVQVLQGETANISSQRGLTQVDLADVIYLLHSGAGLSITLLKVALGLVLAGWIGVFAMIWRGQRRIQNAAD
jgi:hypothetical protein